MTEKDYRLLVTSLELTKDDKENISNDINALIELLNNNIRYFKIDHFDKAGSYASSTMYHNAKCVDIVLVIKDVLNNSFPLMNQAVVSEIWNILLFNYKIDKVNQLQYNSSDNSISLKLENYTLNILIRYLNNLNYQNDYYLDAINERTKFVKLAQEDFKLYTNTLQILKYYRDIENIDSVTDYMIELLLYYGLCENFTMHSYEAYLREFNHALDDFLKGIKIDQDDDMYRKMDKQRAQIVKKSYMIMDITNPYNNLVSDKGEAFISDIRRFKKVILGLFPIDK